MSNSPLKKFVLTPVVISAAVFGTLTLPLAIIGKQPVTIQLQQEPVFQGQLRDIATPYLGLASAISLGAGLASVAFTGWRRSTHKSSQVEAQLSDLEKHLQEKELQLEALKLSESRLAASGLNAFVDENMSLEQALKTAKAQVSAPSVSTAQPVSTEVAVKPSATMQTAAAKFAVTQSLFGYAQGKTLHNPSPSAAQLASQDVEELHAQLQQIMAQMASVQAALSTTRTTDKPENGASSQTTQSWSVHEI
jgi:hypothetical protein